MSLLMIIYTLHVVASPSESRSADCTKMSYENRVLQEMLPKAYTARISVVSTDSTDSFPWWVNLSYFSCIILFDFKKAFDSINRKVIFVVLWHYGIPETVVNTSSALYNNSL